MSLHLAADLAFELDVDGRDPVHGRLRGNGLSLLLEVDDPAAFAGSADAPVIAKFAEVMASYGLVVRVYGDGRHLVSLGAVSAPRWQRRLTGSRRIRLGSVRGAWTAARARTRSTTPVLPSIALMPPPTLWPPLPTFMRRVRRRPTTTHDPARGGAPKLVLVRNDVWEGERQPVFWLGDSTLIGSDPACGIVLPGLSPRHALVTHDAEDEYVVAALEGTTRVHGKAVDRSVLRTGTRLEVGEHQLVFTRDEHADHGRPHGGRIGGEAGRQLPQAPRPHAD